jgi:aminodeoxyfutalosine synthase
MTAVSIESIREKVQAGERLSFDDGLFLEKHPNLLETAQLANIVRERKNGDYAYYNVNTHLNPTNVCVYRCKFCAFRADLKAPKAYVMSDDEILERAQEAHRRGVTEMHIVGGLHHLKDFDWYKRILELIHAEFPEIHLKAFTAVEIDWFTRITKRSIRDVLLELRDAGLGSLPGGGAEIFHPEVRDVICEHKADADRWFEVHRVAHSLGIHSNATMLYGHIERPEHRIDHLVRLRNLQDETGGFQTLIPLAFHPENTNLPGFRRPSGFMDLRTIAISRLMLDNFPHIKAYWIMLGVGIAQTALSFGADDLDGTVVHELIYHDAGADTPEALTVAQIRRLIEEAGRIPVERDTLYNHVHRDENGWRVGEPILVAG